MKKTAIGVAALALAAGLGITLGTSPAQGTGLPGRAGVSVGAPELSSGHELPNPLEEKRRALREEALTEVLSGRAEVQQRGPSTVVKVGAERTPAAVNRRGQGTGAAQRQSQYVELSREKTDKIFVVLTEFGDQRDARYPDKDLEPSIPGPTTFDGPLHNQIPEPDRATDNSTVWQPDYSRSHFQKLYFGTNGRPGSGRDTESVKQYYQRQSSGRYSVKGTVTDWVTVPYNEARYGRSSDDPTTNGDDPNVCADHVCPNTWFLVKDAVNTWVADQEAAGRTAAQIGRELRSFDQWDRYDVDGDGDFNEPDGYIDHFQIVHAGGDEADGDPNQGEDAVCRTAGTSRPRRSAAVARPVPPSVAHRSATPACGWGTTPSSPRTAA